MSETRQAWLRRALLVAWCSLVFAFLVLPILAIIPLSFNAGSFLTFPEHGWSLRWYRTLASSPAWRGALGNSLIVASATTLLALPLGALAALGLWSMDRRWSTWLLGLFALPLVVPVIIVAIGLYFAFARFGLVNSYTGLILAHTVLALPFVLIAVRASLERFDRQLLRAAASLGARRPAVLQRVIVPLLAPGLAAGAIFAFMTSFDETVVALFLAGPQQRTLPLQMFEGVREQVSPAITAAASLLVVASTGLLAAAELLRRRRVS